MYECRYKVILVTGGAAGIGAGIVEAFLIEGATHVAVLDVDINKGKTLQQELTKKYGSNKVKFHKCDVTTSDLDEAFDNIIEEFKYIDVVVNCAGIMNDRRDMYLKEIEINVSALIKSSIKAHDIMRKDKGGKGGTIINISSIAGLTPSRLVPVYSATKGAVLLFSNSLGAEPHYSRSDVRVLILCFGCTDTSIFDTSKMGAFDQESEEMLEELLKTVPFQKPESAVKGLMYAYKHGASASTWLVTSERPAEDITGNVTEGYKIMSQGVYD